MKKPLYVVITPYFPTPESWRGPFCYDFVQAVRRTGRYDVRVFMPGAGDDYEYNGVLVHRFRTRSLRGGLFPFVFSGVNRRSFLEKLASCEIDPCQVEVCHSHELSCLTFALAIKDRNPRAKVLQHFHAMGHPFHLSIPHLGILPVYSTWMYLCARRELERIDLPVFVSKRQQQMFGRWYPKYRFLDPPEDVRKSLTFGRFLREVRLRPSIVLYNGIDYSVFKPDPAQKGARDPGSFVIGDIANFGESKDQLTLIRAAAKLNIKGLKVVLIGSGPMVAPCRDEVRRLHLEGVVEFRTEVDHLTLPDVYRSFDLFVSPSWAEGFCCTYMEAHGCGVPVMGCKGVSIDEAIVPEEWDRWLVVPRDVDALAERMKWFFHNRVEQHFAQAFDIEKLVSSFLDRLSTLTP